MFQVHVSKYGACESTTADMEDHKYEMWCSVGISHTSTSIICFA